MYKIIPSLITMKHIDVEALDIDMRKPYCPKCLLNTTVEVTYLICSSS